jgi:hypothetical protein
MVFGGQDVDELMRGKRMTGNQGLRWLVVAHLALGLLTGALAPIEVRIPAEYASLFPPNGLSQILIVPLFATVTCQAFLFALWAVRSLTSPWLRLGVIVAGTVYLEALIRFGSERELLGCATVTTVATLVWLLLTRWLRVKRGSGSVPVRYSGRKAGSLRFTIRGLMLFTAAVALLIYLMRFVEGLSPHVEVHTFLWGLSFVVAGFIALWSVRCYPSSLRQLPVAFAASVTLGILFARSVNAQTSGWVYILLTMLLYPAFLSGSLMVVRSYDDRLLEGASPHPSATGPVGDSTQIDLSAGQIEVSG